MPSHGRGAYRAAKAATRALIEQTEKADGDIARLMEMWQGERARAEAAEAALKHAQVVADRDLAAETRIAAAVELCEQDWDGFAWWDVAASIKSALTGGRRSIDDATPGEWDAANRRVTGAYGTNGCES